MEVGKLSHKILNACFHRIDVISDFEMWVDNNWGDELTIVVNKEQNTYMYAYGNVRTVIDNTNDYIWYKFKE